MADRAYQGLWAAVTACLVACLIANLAGYTTTVTGSNATGPSPSPPTPAGSAPAAPVRILQLNLCNSGIAGCYTGRSTAQAAALIRAHTPDLITLNEICQDDVPALQHALTHTAPDAVPGDAAAFQAARDRRTGDAYRCRNGRPYGIGIVSRRPPVPGSAAGGIYPTQDQHDPEERAWLCLHLDAPALTVCTTHLADTDREVARAQCRYLFDTVITQMRARDGAAPVVLGGDLNLGPGDSPDLTSCLPAGAALADDGGEQLVVATPEFAVDDSRTIDMRGTTDHPGLLVTLAPRTGRPTP